MALSVSSLAFSEGGKIPPEYTCESDDISPQLDWFGIPKEAKALVLIVDDPDAPGGVFTHWVIFNIPPDSSGPPTAPPPTPAFPDGTLHGGNDFGKTGYGGPCPPSGTHRYFFKVYAIDTDIDLEPRYANKQKVLDEIDGHVLAFGELMGTYKR